MVFKVSNVPYYLDNIEVSFLEYLKDRGASVKTRKNYRSDARHFLGWFILTLQSKSATLPSSLDQFIRLISPKMIDQYKRYLLDNHIPTSTINRRLSTIRSFFHFCQSQGWITTSPAQNLAAIPLKKSAEMSNSFTLLESFKQALIVEGASRATVKNYGSDIRQFLNWLEKKARLH